MPDRIVPVFVVGCPRSGTTLVGELIAASPSVFNGEESFFLYLMHQWARMLKPPVAPLTSTFLSRSRGLIREVISSATLDAGHTHYVDHTPWHALCLEDIWSVFPEARIVHVVRHPAEVMASLHRSYAAGYAWAEPSAKARARLWNRIIDSVRDHERNPRLRVVRYEDLCDSPTEQSRGLVEWVGLPWQREYLTVFTHAHAPNPGTGFALARQTDRGLQFRARQRRPPSPGILRGLGEISDENLARYGYAAEGGAP